MHALDMIEVIVVFPQFAHAMFSCISHLAANPTVYETSLPSSLLPLDQTC